MQYSMEFHPTIFAITLILCVGVSASTTVTPAAVYWKNALPNTPMPTAIKTSLHSVGDNGKISPFQVVHKIIHASWQYKDAATPKEVADHVNTYGDLFMVEPNIIPGTTIDFRWFTSKDYAESSFLPQNVADSIPFSTAKLPEILNRFSVDPKSKEAAAMKTTLRDCEAAPDLGEKRYCATSLEGMVSFVKSILGDRVNLASSTSTASSGTARKTKFGVAGVKKVSDYGSPYVVCHKQTYPYAVFSCHEVSMTAVYSVSLVSKGMNVEALATCHKDTSRWNPKYLGLQVLKVKPGKTTAVCHFLDELTVVWTPK